MEIGYLIKQYRKNNSLTLRDFALKCGTSHSYIAMLESGKNSKTGEPIVPSITMLKKISDGMSIPLNDLIALCDDMPVALGKATTPTEPKLSEGEKLWLQLYNSVSEDTRNILIGMMIAIDKLPTEEKEEALSRVRDDLKSLE